MISVVLYTHRRIDRVHNEGIGAIALLASSLRVKCQTIEETIPTITSNAGLKSYLDSICNDVAWCFSTIKGSKASVSCCMRIADPDSNGSYVTLGRSSGLNPSRSSSSEPVTPRSEIYRALTREGADCNDVVIIADLSEAIEKGQITKDKNMEIYQDEICSMMVSRLNARKDGGNSPEETLWGILYVSSRDKDDYTDSDSLYMQIVSNLVSSTLWTVSDYRRKTMERNNDAQPNEKTDEGSIRKVRKNKNSGGSRKQSKKRQRR